MVATLMKPPPFVVEAERVFRHFNEHLFGGSLMSPIILLAFGRRIGVKFYASSYEFVIGNNILHWTSDHFLSEFLHEMLHLYNYQRGVTDCTLNQYHNQEFVQAALNVGFYVGKHKARGYAITMLAPAKDDMAECRVPEPGKNAHLCATFRSLKFDAGTLKNVQQGLREKKERHPSKTFLVKWVCRCSPPHNCIRSGRRPDGPNPLQVKCMKCDAMFTAASYHEEN